MRKEVLLAFRIPLGRAQTVLALRDLLDCFAEVGALSCGTTRRSRWARGESLLRRRTVSWVTGAQAEVWRVNFNSVWKAVGGAAVVCYSYRKRGGPNTFRAWDNSSSVFKSASLIPGS